MLVVIANDLPPAIRGRMKLWFIEPRPNVFVSGIKDAVAEKVISYLHRHCPKKSGLLIFEACRQAPGFTLHGMGTPSKQISTLSGFPIIIEKDSNP